MKPARGTNSPECHSTLATTRRFYLAVSGNLAAPDFDLTDCLDVVVARQVLVQEFYQRLREYAAGPEFIPEEWCVGGWSGCDLRTFRSEVIEKWLMEPEG